MPGISRRTALTVGIGTAGVAALAATAHSGSISSAISTFVESFDRPVIPARSVFAGSIGEAFAATPSAPDAHRVLSVTLSSIEDLESATAENDEDRFNLLFASNDPAFEPGIYRFTRAGVPTTELFVSPINADGETRRLQALINRIA